MSPDIVSRPGLVVRRRKISERPTFDENRLSPVLYLPLFFPPIASSPVLVPTAHDPDAASLSLHKALHHFKAYSADCAARQYSEAFNWDQLVLPVHEERDWYSLLLYWYGIPDQDTGMNLATCIWQSRKHAIAANSQPFNIQAMRLAAQSYEVYTLERYVLRKVAGSTDVTVESFTGTLVGWR
ncbi:hypothetical protein GGX14DRAFT_533599 [Mycena pura]|uniref:Uncharacterized protein n=1 Tax=Mycena pura TaxID=153505 RepID=A0AAD6VRI4_9AGAR|nr:hypothetical protein GGX14DRAFT_533599 [Mycena pura]